MDSSRANFSPKTKGEIAQKANYLCSFNSGDFRCLRLTSCKSLTLSEKDKASTPLLMGDACHIVAASPQGPRGDSAMTAEERSSEQNGIWLCQIHAEWIDKNNGNGYSVEQLHAMRKSHEDYVRNALEKGFCEYLDTKNGRMLTVINEFAYPDELCEQVVGKVYENDGLSVEQIEECANELSNEMDFWAKEPIMYRQLVGTVFQYGAIDNSGFNGTCVWITPEKLTQYMDGNKRLIDEFIAELNCHAGLFCGFDYTDPNEPFESPARIWIRSDILCYLKEQHPAFRFQNFFMYGEASFPNS